MAASQNGWRANDRSTVSTRTVPGTNVALAVRNGAAGDLLLEVAARIDREVEDIDNGRGGLDDWGYAERPVRGGTDLSNHASGTAIDLNAPRHPLGAVGTFTAAQTARIRAIVAATGGAVRWGGDYTKRKDEMHFEINDGVDEARCARALAALRGAGPAAAAGPRTLRLADPFMRGDDVAAVQRVAGVRVDGVYGPATTDAVKRWQAGHGLAADGVVGPKTRAAMRL